MSELELKNEFKTILETELEPFMIKREIIKILTDRLAFISLGLLQKFNKFEEMKKQPTLW